MNNSNRIFLIVFVILLGAIGSVSAADLTANWDFSEGAGGIATDNINSIVATFTNFDDPDLAWGTAATCKMSATGTIELDGADDYLIVPYNANLDPDAGDFSVAFWLYLPADESGQILNNGTSGGGYSGKRWCVDVYGSTLRFTIDDNVDKAFTQTAYAEFREEWHYIICRKISNVGLEIWIDGTRVGAAGAATVGDVVEEGEDFYIGRRGPDETPNSFGGKIADLRFYKGDLTNAGIVAMSPSSLAPWCPTPEDGAAAAASTDLRWEAPSDANTLWTYDVYIGTDPDPIANGTPYLDNLGGSDPNLVNAEFGPLSIGATYYWQVVANDPNGATESDPARASEIWSLIAGVPAPVLESPTDGSGGWGLELALDWTSDNTSGLIVQHKLTLHNVTADTFATAYIPAVSDTTPLNNVDLWPVVFYGRDYEWQITELGAGDEVLVEGPVWSFSTLALQCTALSAPADIDGDCKVTLDDFALMASSWLECGWQLEGGAIPFTDKDPCLQ